MNQFEDCGNFEIDGFRLINTCTACPEQYDVKLGDETVGYLRLRHGYFSADYPDVSGHEVYGSPTIGDGIFHSGEREKHLRNAIAAIRNACLSQSDEIAELYWMIQNSMDRDFKRVEALPDLTDPIEVMARAMWRGPLPLDSHECRQFARLAVEGLQECGFAVVPVEPTQEMAKEGAERVTREATERDIETRFWSIVDRDGLSGLPSDMWAALDSLVNQAALARKYQSAFRQIAGYEPRQSPVLGLQIAREVLGKRP